MDVACSLQTGTSVSPSNRPGHFHRYEIIVDTGKRRHAGTSARVALVMSGDKSTSQPYLLKAGRRPTLTRASVDAFLVTTSESLGELSCIRVWHDNSGSQPAWYVKQISVREVESELVWHFLCERWLAVDESDGMIDRVFPVTSDKELMESKHLFLTKAYTDLTDSHLWFSVLWRPPQSPFTRVQRVSCCLSLLLCSMMANAMWYDADRGRYTAVDLGPFQFSWEQISIGICSSLVVFPVNLLLVQIFRHCKPVPASSGSCCGNTKRNSKERAPSIDTTFSLKSGYRTMRSTISPEVSDAHDTFHQSNTTHKLDNWAVSLRSIRLRPLTTIFSTDHSSRVSISSSVNLISLRQNSPSSISDRSKPSSPEPKGLPWWFVYVGWLCVVLTSSAAAAVTLLYGIDFGRRKSEQWLFSLFVSVVQDVFLNQPLKVVMLAVFFAYILKKPAPIYRPSYATLQDDEELVQSYEDAIEESTPEMGVAVPTVSVPPESSLNQARERRMKERQMHVILFDLATFLVFTLLVLLIAYGHRDKEAFRQNTAMTDILLKPAFRERKPQRYAEVGNRDIEIPLFRRTGRTPCFSIFFHVFFFSYFVITSHHATR